MSCREVPASLIYNRELVLYSRLLRLKGSKLHFLRTRRVKRLYTISKLIVRWLPTRRLYKRIRRLYRRIRRLYRRIRHLFRRSYRYHNDRKTRRVRRLLSFSQEVRFITQLLLGIQNIRLRVPGVRTPLYLRKDSADYDALWQVFGERQLEIPHRPLQDVPQLIVDGGANVGFASIYFATKYPQAQIIAIEPEPGNCTMFRKNCSAYPNIELIQGGVWSSNESLVIKDRSAGNMSFRLMKAASQGNSSIKGYTLTDILMRSGKQHIDLLKLDIEGAEEQLFSSHCSSNWLDSVKHMIIEPHGDRALSAILNATKNRGFTVTQSGEYLVFARK